MTVEEGDDGHHHLPAVDDWPRGFGEASWWPFVTAAGASGIYVAAALFVLGRGESAAIGSMWGPAAFILSVGMFLAGLYGWTYHAFVVSFWDHDGSSGGKLRWGMLLFLGSEIATFGAGFIYYFFIRSGPWNSAALPHLLGSLILINTAILIASSVTLHYAHTQLRAGNRDSFVRWLAVTLILGLVFIGGQVYEYYEFIVVDNFAIWSTEGLEQIFATAFYGLTGLHGLHVSLGAVLLGIVLVRALKGQYDAERHTSVSTVSMYWHFVDAVWIFLVVAVYVGATFGL